MPVSHEPAPEARYHSENAFISYADRMAMLELIARKLTGARRAEARRFARNPIRRQDQYRALRKRLEALPDATSEEMT
jgi:hypothetical protein